MRDFQDIAFKGQFRDYQQRILDNAKMHLKDHKIHIVAAPGSGKTILGLELIRRLNQPALILSPSQTVRQQWGDRFKNHFLDNEDLQDYVSYQIKHPQLLTSITYQAFYSAFQKIETEEDDYTRFDFIKTIQESHIKTICLDEAHHLKSEWQKALETFLSQLPNDYTIISLTATPPYDSTVQQWNRYIKLCGEIDEEIFVPELVAQKNLCPHQDYIYFNYPTIQETQVIQQQRRNTIQCVQDILSKGLYQKAIQASQIEIKYLDMEELILENISDFVALMTTCQYANISLPKKCIHIVSPRGKLPRCTIEHIQQSFQFIINHPEIFSESISQELKLYLSVHHLYDRKQVQLISTEKTKKMLVSSIGKLQSIQQIVQSESETLKEQLRLLILTDHIKKDLYSVIGTDLELMTLGCVPIFETLRRHNQEKIAVLSGSLIILSKTIQKEIEELAYKENMMCQFQLIGSTQYCKVVFNGSNKHIVKIITEAFQKGLINILMSTKSLLGEGWDCPCINALILASTVGSFVLSNQMRGRAIRIDHNHPNKTANIWHLITIEPPLVLHNQKQQQFFHDFFEQRNQINSYDFDVLKKRFDGFLAPAYHQDVIESGIERLDIIQPPFTREGIQNINNQMLSLANDRKTMATRWNATLNGNIKPHIRQVQKISSKIHPKGYLFQNAILLLIMDIIFTFITRMIHYQVNLYADTLIRTIIADIALTIIGYILARYHLQFLHCLTPKRMIYNLSQCVLKTLQEIGEIQSPHIELLAEADDETMQNVYCSLNHATLHEQTLFAQALSQLFSGIDNPKYIIIKHIKIFGIKKFNYTISYTCPQIIATKKEYVQIFIKHLHKIGDFSFIYTRQIKGRKELLKCRQYSYLNINECYISGKKMIKKDWQ